MSFEPTSVRSCFRGGRCDDVYGRIYSVGVRSRPTVDVILANLRFKKKKIKILSSTQRTTRENYFEPTAFVLRTSAILRGAGGTCDRLANDWSAPRQKRDCAPRAVAVCAPRPSRGPIPADQLAARTQVDSYDLHP